MKFRLGRYEAVAERTFSDLTAKNAAQRLLNRDPTLWGGNAPRQAAVANRLGWVDLPTRMQAHLDELRSFASDVDGGGFTSLVLLGMGGSSLAPEVLARSIEPARGSPPLYVLDSTDPLTIRNVERAIDPARTLFFVSSKSGGTIEVATLFAYFHELVSQVRGSAAGQSFVAITDPGTQLAALATERGFRRTFINPPDVGGRYSALSYFGLAPAAASGVDVGRLLGSAVLGEHEHATEGGDALRLGATIGALAREGRDKLTLLVSSEIAALGLWLEQLIAESTGKEGAGVIPVADEPLGSPLRYGDDRLFVHVRLEGGYTGEQDSVLAALVAEGHPAIVIDLDSPYDLGRQFYAWEFATAVAGVALGINPFDEPNVQESKDNRSRVLQRLEQEGVLDAPELAGRSAVIAPGAPAEERLDRAIATLLDRVKPGGYFAITSYIAPSDEANAGFADIRARIRDGLGVATTLGYGPRFLHSTGQLHKGGPAGGVFLQVTADDPQDVEIPGRSYTFGQLKRAQAIGDYESLVAHERPILRVHLGSDVSRGLEQVRHAVRLALPAAGSATTA